MKVHVDCRFKRRGTSPAAKTLAYVPRFVIEVGLGSLGVRKIIETTSSGALSSETVFILEKVG